MNVRLPTPRIELLALVLLAWAAFIAIPLTLGGISLSWDALNHHVYLGWIADHPRFDRDYLAASGQSFQYPYLYWPFFKLFEAGIPGRWAGAVLVTLYLPAVPALWLLARRMVPDRDAYGLAMRATAVLLAFASGLVLSLFDTTASDLYAAIPLVWAVALAFEASEGRAAGQPQSMRLLVLSGLCAGLAVAFKLSNGPLALVLPLLWLRGEARQGRRLGQLLLAGIATLAGVALGYGRWGWLLWQHYGNPVYPFYEVIFLPLRSALGWHP